MEKILCALRSQAITEQPKNNSVAAFVLFEQCKTLLLLKKATAFTQWLNSIDALIDEDTMRQCGLGSYVDNGYVMLNPRVLGTTQQQYLFFAFPRTARTFQAILSQYEVDSLIVEISMSNSTYGMLIGWPWAFV